MALKQTNVTDVISLIDDEEDIDPDVQLTHVIQQSVSASSRKRQRHTDPPDTIIATEPYSPIDAVTEVFPDADVKFVAQSLEKYNNEVVLVISFMAENDYPKRPAKKMVSPSTTIDFMSKSSFEPSNLYKSQVQFLLMDDFAFLSVRGAQELLVEARYHYAVVHDKIWNAARGSDPDEVNQYRRLQQIESSGHLPFIGDLRKVLGVQAVNKSIQRRTKPLLTDATLVAEIKYVRAKVQNWMDEMEKRNARVLNKELSDRNGTGIECSCCFDSFPIDDMVGCRDEGHLFCTDCLEKFAENQIFGQGNLGVDKVTKKPAMELKCFVGDCNSGFEHAFLLKSLPPKLLEECNRLQGLMNMKAAGLEDCLYQCPKCYYHAEVFPTLRVFECPKCHYESCIKCGKDAHVPMT